MEQHVNPQNARATHESWYKKQLKLTETAYKLGFSGTVAITMAIFLVTFVLSPDDPAKKFEAFKVFGTHVLATFMMMLFALLGLDGYERMKKNRETEALAEDIADHLLTTRFSNVDVLIELHGRLVSNLDFSNPENALAKKNYLGVSRVSPRLIGESFITRNVDGDIYILNTWIPNEWAWEEIRKCIKRGNSAHILLIDRTDPFVKTRAHMLGVAYEGIAANVLQSYFHIKHIHSDLRGDERNRLRLRLYRGAPPCSLYCINKHAFMGFFSVGEKAVNGLTFEFSLSSDAGTAIWRQFEALWSPENNIDVDLSIDPKQYKAP